MRIFWIIVLVLSVALLGMLLIPTLDIYTGIHTPSIFKAKSGEPWTYLWWSIPSEKQIGFMLLTGVLMMLPGRTIALAMIKLSKKRRRHAYS